MSYTKNKLINNALNRSYALTDYNIHNDIHKRHEFKKQTILDDESLTENEKSEAIRILTKTYDLAKLLFNEGTKRICENCNQECLAITFCEYCVRNYLKAKFSNWTSGNLDIDLRKYLQQNHNQLTWKERIQIITDITIALRRIHEENAIHRDLHSGNILYNLGYSFRISDLGFCGPADKPLKSIYGNLPYIAPEVIIGKEQTFKSDIYSISMLMWEISSGQPPFNNHEHDYDLAMNIVNGIRPKIVPGTPLEYKNLMKQCWDADPSKRPDIITLRDKMREINIFYQTKSSELSQIEENNNFEVEKHTSSSKLFTSKLHQFDNLPEPRNATEEEQEAFHSNKSYNFQIPDNIDDFNKSSSKKNTTSTSKINSMFKAAKNHPIYLKEAQKMANVYKIESMRKRIKKLHINDNDEEEVHNNPNLHSEEQDELELPDNTDKLYK
ncbi:kinase-like protein [Rhizophagus irregularis]|nr:kinase-like protein [Rhizophagus irregularis]